MLCYFLFSCKKQESFSDIPYLEFVRYELKDSTDALGNQSKFCNFYLHFTDGDGDIGLFETDTMGSFQYNLFVNYFELHQDSLYQVEVNPPFHSRIPDLTPVGQNKSLKADIQYEVNITYRNSDTIQFRFKLLDRALNESEWVNSGMIVVN